MKYFQIIIYSSILVVLIVLMISVINSNIDSNEETTQEKIVINTEEEIIQLCSNMSLINTSYCLKDSVKSFYIYNVTDDSLNLSFKQLKQRGGDCRDWALLYERLGKKLGFSTYSFHIEDSSKGHRFAVLYKQGEAFCVINMVAVECFKSRSE